jgi:predicted XRE-type DNA-binding protein
MGPSTQVNPEQRHQIPMRMMAAVPEPKKVEDWQLATCNDLLDAIHVCIHLSRMKHYDIAEQLGIDRGHWTRMMQGQAHFPTRKLGQLMKVCGNYAPMQFLARESGFQLFEDPVAMEKAKLKKRLAELEGQGPSTGINAFNTSAMVAA